MNGDIAGDTSVVVKESANVDGNIYSPTVTLREGATFNGKIDMSGKNREKTAKPPKAKKADKEPVADSRDKTDDHADKERTAGAA